jgi:adsorption protein B
MPNPIIAFITALAAWIVISGFDDLTVDLAFLWSWIRRGGPAAPTDCELRRVREKRVAVFVPLWREDRVIGKMLEHNLAAIDYGNYDFFVGAYPNDDATLEAIREWEGRSPRVHLAVCPHDGPTSKADCLNSIFQQMALYEERNEVVFHVVVTHDAEDLIHPDELLWINFYVGAYDMVQIPVLPLESPFRQFTHGLYCDEFAEFQSKDVPVRRMLGGFVPSNGVGTGYTRSALEKLAAAGQGRIFDPASLTEDYESGLRLHRLGCPQLFVPIRFKDGKPVATREYFPACFRDAVKQRTRWVMGIGLQSWERHGWKGGLSQVYWFWRDRKGLAGNLTGLLANAIFLGGAGAWVWRGGRGVQWPAIGQPAAALFTAALVFQTIRLGVRVVSAARIYGWKFAAGTPVRAIWGNWINGFATICALRRYFSARLRHQPLAWLKTEHTYPARRLGEMLVSYGYVSPVQAREALESKPAGLRLGEHLVGRGVLSEDKLYQVLSAQKNLPLEQLDPQETGRHMARHLPARLVEQWKIIPFRIDSGHLLIAGTEPLTENARRDVQGHTRLKIRYSLITPSNFEQLRKALI